MSEESILGNDRKYEVSPTHIDLILKHLKKYPERYNNEREFIFRAIDMFLAWETDPKYAEKKMREFAPTIAQFAQIKQMMKPEQLKEMYPEFEEKNSKELEKFIKDNPEYAGVPQTAEQEQLHERESQHDFEKLVDSMDAVIKVDKDSIDSLSKIKKNIDGLIYETGWFNNFNNPDIFYGKDRPTIPLKLIKKVIAMNINFFGCDLPSVDKSESVDKKVHHNLLYSDIIIYESLTNLNQLPLLKPFHFYGFPLPFIGLDGSPIRAVGIIN